MWLLLGKEDGGGAVGELPYAHPHPATDDLYGPGCSPHLGLTGRDRILIDIERRVARLID